MISDTDFDKALQSIRLLIDGINGEQSLKDMLLAVVERVFVLDRHEAWFAAAPAITYSEYLKTDHWQKVRRESFELFGGRCGLCNSSEQLEAHHRTYASIGRERPHDVICLCRKCHGYFHLERTAEGQKTKPIKERETKTEDKKRKKKIDKKQPVPCSDSLVQGVCERLTDTNMTKQILETYVGSRWLRHGELEVFMPDDYTVQVLNRFERKEKIDTAASSILGSNVKVIFSLSDDLPEEI